MSRIRRRWQTFWSRLTIRWTIGHELPLLVLAVLLPFAAVGLVWANEDYRTEQARTQARALRHAHEVSAEVDQFIADTAALVEALARVPSVKRGEQPEGDQLLSELAERYSYYESLFAVDSAGRVLATGGDDVLPPGNRLSYVRQALASGATIVTEPIAPRNSTRHVFVVATPLWDETGKPIGIVGVSVNLLRLQEGIRRTEVPENSSLLVVDQNGRIVARRTDPEKWVGLSALESSAVRNALRLREGVAEGDFVDGVRRLSGFAPTQRVPWEVIVGIPTDDVYGALRRELWRSLARLALAGAVAGLVALILGRRLTQPIREVVAAARAYAGGALAHRVYTRGPVELAALGTALNRMAADLQRQMDELQAAHARERQAEREAGERALAELKRLHSEFIAVAAHELRTPVAAAKSYAELLQRDDVSLAPAVRRQALRRLDAVSERLSRLVRSLLGASRIQAGRLEVQREPVDLAGVARRVVDEFSAYAPGHDVRLVAAPAPLALGDADRIEDVLVNLLSNAAKYSPPNTVIQVRVHRVHPLADDASMGGALTRHRPPEGANGSVKPVQVVELEVADQGPGIPTDEQAAVFERFRRGRGVAAGGVGLGLYIAQAYVQAMGGQIGVRSALGQGAAFWFRLPAAAEVASPAAEGRPPGNRVGSALAGLAGLPAAGAPAARRAP